MVLIIQQETICLKYKPKVKEELDSPAYPDDFQDVEVKEEPMEYDAVSCDLF